MNVKSNQGRRIRLVLLVVTATLATLLSLLFVAFQPDVPAWDTGLSASGWAVLFALTAVAAVAAIRRRGDEIRLVVSMTALCGVLVAALDMPIAWPPSFSLQFGLETASRPALFERYQISGNGRWLGIPFLLLAAGLVIASRLNASRTPGDRSG